MFENMIKSWGYVTREEFERAVEEAKKIIQEERDRLQQEIELAKAGSEKQVIADKAKLSAAHEMLLKLRESKDNEIKNLNKLFRKFESDREHDLERFGHEKQKLSHAAEAEKKRLLEGKAHAESAAKEAHAQLKNFGQTSERTKKELIKKLSSMEKKIQKLAAKTKAAPKAKTPKKAAAKKAGKAKAKQSKKRARVVVRPEIVVRPRMTVKPITTGRKKAKKQKKKAKKKGKKR